MPSTGNDKWRLGLKMYYSCIIIMELFVVPVPFDPYINMYMHDCFQTYKKCTAEVDPLVVAAIPNLSQCFKTLTEEFGVEVTLSAENRFSLTGSLVQIQSAQTWLDDVYHGEQMRQQQNLLEIGQEINIPGSDTEGSLLEEGSTGKGDKEWDAFQRKMYNTCDVSRSMPEKFLDNYTGFMREMISQTDRRSKGDKKSLYAQNEDDVNKLFSTGRHRQGRGDPKIRGDTAERGQKTNSHMRSITPQKERLTATLPVTRQSKVPPQKAKRLMATEPKLAWSGKSRDILQDVRKATLELDSVVTDYVKRYREKDIQQIEGSHGVKFFFEFDKAAAKVTILHMDDFDSESIHMVLDKAKEDFTSLYQSVFYSVVKETVDYNPLAVSRDEQEAVISAVKKAFSGSVLIREDISGEIILAGEWKQLSLAADWIKEKLRVKRNPKTSAGSANPKGLRSKFIEGEGDDRGKLVLMMAPASGPEALDGLWDQRKASKLDDLFSSTVPVSRKSDALASENRLSSTMPEDRNRRGQLVANMRSPTASGSLIGDANQQRKRNDLKVLETLGFDMSSRTGVTGFEFTAANALKVKIYSGDITKATTDVIVNATNENLRNVAGVARAIADAAGDEFQLACVEHIAKYGTLKVIIIMLIQSFNFIHACPYGYVFCQNGKH